MTVSPSAAVSTWGRYSYTVHAQLSARKWENQTQEVCGSTSFANGAVTTAQRSQSLIGMHASGWWRIYRWTGIILLPRECPRVDDGRLSLGRHPKSSDSRPQRGFRPSLYPSHSFDEDPRSPTARRSRGRTGTLSGSSARFVANLSFPVIPRALSLPEDTRPTNQLLLCFSSAAWCTFSPILTVGPRARNFRGSGAAAGVRGETSFRLFNTGSRKAGL